MLMRMVIHMQSYLPLPKIWQVWKGDSDKLLVYFQGKGTCFDHGKVVSGEAKCTTSIAPQPQGGGVFDRHNPLNPFRDYTIVHALDCSCDGWIGDIRRETGSERGMEQRGVWNARTTISWIHRQVREGHLARKLSNVVVMGCSGGGLAVQAWGPLLISNMTTQSAALVVDSYLGVMPPRLDHILTSMNCCTTASFTHELRGRCQGGELTIDRLATANIKSLLTKKVPVAFIQSKVDAHQKDMYIEMGRRPWEPSFNIEDRVYYANINLILYNHNTNPNFVVYLVGRTFFFVRG